MSDSASSTPGLNEDSDGNWTHVKARAGAATVTHSAWSLWPGYVATPHPVVKVPG